MKVCEWVNSTLTLLRRSSSPGFTRYLTPPKLTQNHFRPFRNGKVRPNGQPPTDPTCLPAQATPAEGCQSPTRPRSHPSPSTHRSQLHRSQLRGNKCDWKGKYKTGDKNMKRQGSNFFQVIRFYFGTANQTTKQGNKNRGP